MELKVIRSVITPVRTLGKMYLNNAFFAYTMEDAVRQLGADCMGKIKTQTAIDYGHYEVILNFSDRFKRYLPLLLQVPCFEAIRIHGGNTEENSEGCILIGAESNMQDKIWNCAGKVNALVTQLKSVERKEKIWIDIVK